jgi:MFS transporter, FHS family, glucose/mannose:H+ symporter
MNKLAIKLSLFFNFFLFAILLNSVGIVILQVQRYFGVLESSASVLEIFKDISLAAASFLLVSFISKVGYKKSMLLALGIMAVTCFVVPLLKTLLAIKVLFAMAGACFGLMKISILGTIGTITENEKAHLSMMNFIESFFMVGIVSGYFIFGSYIDDALPGSANWFNAYYLVGTLSVTAFIFLLFLPMKEEEMMNNESREFKSDFSSLFKLLFFPLVLTFIGGIFLYTLIEQSIMCWLPTFNNKQLQIPSSISVMITGILALSIATGRFVAGFLLKKMEWYKLLLFCIGAIFLLVTVTLPFTGRQTDLITNWVQIPVVAYIFPLIGFFMAPIYPVINSVILSALPKSKHALMAGLIIIFSSLGGMSGSLVTGFLFQLYGGKAAFYFSLLPVAALVLILYFFKRNKDRVSINNRYDAMWLVAV